MLVYIFIFYYLVDYKFYFYLIGKMIYWLFKLFGDFNFEVFRLCGWRGDFKYIFNFIFFYGL